MEAWIPVASAYSISHDTVESICFSIFPTTNGASEQSFVDPSGLFGKERLVPWLAKFGVFKVRDPIFRGLYGGSRNLIQEKRRDALKS